MAGEQCPPRSNMRNTPLGAYNTTNQMVGDDANAAASLGTNPSQDVAEGLQTPKISFNECGSPTFHKYEDLMDAIYLEDSDSLAPQKPVMKLAPNPSAISDAGPTTNTAQCTPSQLKFFDYFIGLDDDKLAEIASSDGLLELDTEGITQTQSNDIVSTLESDNAVESEGGINSEQTLANFLLASDVPSNCLDPSMKNSWNLMPSVLSPSLPLIIPSTKTITQSKQAPLLQAGQANYFRPSQTASGKNIQSAPSFSEMPENIAYNTTNLVQPNTEYKTLFCVQQATASTDSGQHKISVSIPKTFLDNVSPPTIAPRIPQKRKIVQDILPNVKLRKVTLVNNTETGIKTAKLNNTWLPSNVNPIKTEKPDLVQQINTIESIPGPSTEPLVNLVPTSSYGSDEHNLIIPDVVHTIGRTTDTDSDDNELMIDNFNKLPYSRLPSRQQKEIDAEKYRRNVAANNEASKRCRQRKKAAKLKLEEEVEMLQARNEELRNKVEDLDKKKTILFQYFKETLKVKHPKKQCCNGGGITQ